MFGDNVTLADAFLVPQVYNARRFKVPLDDFPNSVAASNAATNSPRSRTRPPKLSPTRAPDPASQPAGDVQAYRPDILDSAELGEVLILTRSGVNEIALFREPFGHVAADACTRAGDEYEFLIVRMNDR